MYYIQEVISSVKQIDLLKAMAIVNIFETGKPFGEFAAVAVLNDGAGISYGISQFTHRSGSLAAVVERYLELGGTVGRFVLENALRNLRRNEPVVVRTYAKDERVKKALRAAAVTREMRSAQLQIAFEKYLRPAVEECDRLGFILPLSLAVVFDSITHGSYEKIHDRVRVTSLGDQFRTAEAVTLTFEKAWITEYIRRRDRWLASIVRLTATRYRTRFFLNQIMLGSWELKLPLNVNGFWLRDEHLESILKFADETIGDGLAAGPELNPHETNNNSLEPPTSSQTFTSTPQAQPPADRVGSPTVKKGAGDDEGALADARASDTSVFSLNDMGAAFDRVDAIVSGIAYRTDRVKSLWTTVVGTIWQAAWAVFGFFVGLPRLVWLVVAVIAAVLMLVYLYRQIELGKLREQQNSL
jgi:hypothetical protein